ncbi:MAG: helix-turn-helix domain-containing protein [Anaerovibrio sp.]|uniref:helix-turn-helix domain-containing protein n=1 Tax=Anaerovibrio sp. TaxID=1872532 RepID=UPI0025DD560E|nr:helix-turn-helix domain-containing protein [Anaerovibrio sp.]MCR5176820.1 helix-turn-helix domain-containing protein [Anaerovibrio sp.]
MTTQNNRKTTENFKPQFLSASKVAQIMGVSRGHIYDLVKAKEMPSSKLGNKIIIPIAYLEETYGVAL